MKTKIKPIALNKKNNFILVFLILAIFVFLYLNERNKVPAEEGVGIKLGQYAPNFETEYLNGSKFELYDLRGKPVILNFWASWCPPCIREMPALQKFYDETKVAVIGINLGEDKKTIEEFIKKLNITYPIVLDKDGKIRTAYNLRLRPTTYFINENGVIKDKKYGELSYNESLERADKIIKKQ